MIKGPRGELEYELEDMGSHILSGDGILSNTILVTSHLEKYKILIIQK